MASPLFNGRVAPINTSEKYDTIAKVASAVGFWAVRNVVALATDFWHGLGMNAQQRANLVQKPMIAAELAAARAQSSDRASETVLKRLAYKIGCINASVLQHVDLTLVVARDRTNYNMLLKTLSTAIQDNTIHARKKALQDLYDRTMSILPRSDVVVEEAPPSPIHALPAAIGRVPSEASSPIAVSPERDYDAKDEKSAEPAATPPTPVVAQYVSPNPSEAKASSAPTQAASPASAAAPAAAPGGPEAAEDEYTSGDFAADIETPAQRRKLVKLAKGQHLPQFEEDQKIELSDILEIMPEYAADDLSKQFATHAHFGALKAIAAKVETQPQEEIQKPIFEKLPSIWHQIVLAEAMGSKCTKCALMDSKHAEWMIQSIADRYNDDNDNWLYHYLLQNKADKVVSQFYKALLEKISPKVELA